MSRRERILNLAERDKVHAMLKSLYGCDSSTNNLRGPMLKDQLCEIMPIIEKAAPLVASLVKNDKASILIGLLGLIVNCNPTDEEKLVEKLKNDNDLYTKLTDLENTHGNWLLNQS